jgi:uncharacterized protein
VTLTEVAIVVVASLVGAFVKSVTGMGYPLLAVPLITLALGIEEAVVVVAFPNLVANAVLCFGAREGRRGSRDVPALVIFGFAGALLGTVALVSIPEDPLLVGLAMTIAAFLVTYVRSPQLRIAPDTSRRWSPLVGALAGMAQGAVGVSGPVVATWMHGYRLSKQAYVFSVTAIFGVSGAVQLALLLAAGKMTADRAAVSALALVAVAAVLPLGTRLRTRLGGPAFERAVVAVLAASGAALVVRVLA